MRKFIFCKQPRFLISSTPGSTRQSSPGSEEKHFYVKRRISLGKIKCSFFILILFNVHFFACPIEAGVALLLILTKVYVVLNSCPDFLSLSSVHLLLFLFFDRTTPSLLSHRRNVHPGGHPLSNGRLDAEHHVCCGSSSCNVCPAPHCGGEGLPNGPRVAQQPFPFGLSKTEESKILLAISNWHYIWVRVFNCVLNEANLLCLVLETATCEERRG